MITDIREYQEAMKESFYAVATPLNISLVILLVTVIYYQYIRKTEPYKLPSGPAPVVFQTFTPRTLLKNNGTNDAPVYLAVKGKVYDVRFSKQEQSTVTWHHHMPPVADIDCRSHPVATSTAPADPTRTLPVATQREVLHVSHSMRTC